MSAEKKPALACVATVTLQQDKELKDYNYEVKTPETTRRCQEWLSASLLQSLLQTAAVI